MGMMTVERTVLESLSGSMGMGITAGVHFPLVHHRLSKLYVVGLVQITSMNCKLDPRFLIMFLVLVRGGTVLFVLGNMMAIFLWDRCSIKIA